MEKRGKILKWINYFMGSKYSRAFPPYSLHSMESKEFPGSSDGKESPATQKMWIRSLSWEDPLEEEMELTPVFLPEESHGQRSLEGYNPWDHKESDMTEQLTLALFFKGNIWWRKLALSGPWVPCEQCL